MAKVLKTDKLAARKTDLVAACKSFFSSSDLKHTQKVMNAARAYRRQLRKHTKKVKAVVRKSRTSRKAA